MPPERLSVDEPSIIARAFRRATQSRPVPGNSVRLLVDGPEAFEVMLDLIAKAERWIHFENYIFRSDDTGWRFAKALAARAREGLKVKLLYDWIGSFSTSAKLWSYLRGEGLEVRAFNPPSLLDIFANFTRDHRKLAVADGARAVVGGLCIGDEWAGQPERGSQPWRDSAVELVGPSAAIVDQSFAEMWALAGQPLPNDERAGEVEAPGSTWVQVVSGKPGRGRIYRIVDLLASSSEQRMWITDAYLVAPRRLFYAWRNAAREGVDVRLLVPSTSDVPVVRNLTRIGYRDLLRAGVRIFEWEGAMLHAKTQVSDGRWSRIGSSNLNPASLMGNYELDILLDDRKSGEAMEAQFRRDIARSAEVVVRPRDPGRVLHRLPGALTRRLPSESSRHRPSRRERRQRAVLALRIVASAARRSTFVPVSLALVVLGGLFLALPRVMGYVFGAVLVWLALGAGLESFRRRASDSGA